MAMSVFYQSMHDVRFKPKRLISLTKEHLPDENGQSMNTSELTRVLSEVKTHGLLSESVGSSSVDQIVVDKWKSAVDSWIERLLLLMSSKMIDKRWAGICLLGVTIEECSAARFLDSYSAWFQNLLLQIQKPSESQLVKVASCACLSDMFTRLSGILSIKKDASSLAGKLCQPVLKLLTEEAPESVWEGAVDLISILLNHFPSSMHRHYDSVESVIVSKILSGKCNADLSKKLAYCLALLPRTKGDEESWSIMLQKILIYINSQLNEAFQGLEEETKGSEATKLLVQPGKDPPPPLGGEASNQTSDHLFDRVSTLMQCCSMMLTNPYAIPVSVPIRPLVALIKRVLVVDGSSSQSLLSFMTVTQQENICSKLPILHLHTLELLTALIKGIRSQLLPSAAEVIRLINAYFRRCMFPALRIKVYSITKILLTSMGIGMALYLAPEVINNAFIDLDSNVSFSIQSKQPQTYASNKKRKHSTISPQNGGVEPPLISKPTTPISVQIAALQALEALLTVGGSLQSESWRSNVDNLLVTVAANACESGWGQEERADFQLAALHALLASFLSPARHRPPYLERGLELFRRGKQETGTKLAEFCAHALLALEVLLHPRALPLGDYSYGNSNAFDEGVSKGGSGLFDKSDPDDWLLNVDEFDFPAAEITMDKNVEKLNQVSENQGPDIMDVDQGPGKKPNLDKSRATGEISQAANVFGNVVVTSENVVIPSKSIASTKVTVLDKSVTALDENVAALDENTVIPRKATVSATVSAPDRYVSALDENVTGLSKDVSASSRLVSGDEKMEEDKSDTDSIPDIVGDDPDTDDDVL
ncbi:hypothetical protein ACHQM5_008150 [Ranunculus cassubicifolius]